MTLKRLRVNLGKTERSKGLTYVALSRVTELNGLLIDSRYFGEHRLALITLDPDMVAHDAKTDLLELATRRIVDNLDEPDSDDNERFFNYY